MSVQKLAVLETSIQTLRERLKSQEISRSSLESRLQNIENKCSLFINASSKQQKQNYTNFDATLAQSHGTQAIITVFTSSLKRVDANCLANIQKLEDFIVQNSEEQRQRFLEIQQKLLSILMQKEKVIRNIALQVDNHSISVRALEEWVNTEHEQSNAFKILEENLNKKVDITQKNNDMKHHIIQQQLKYLQKMQESASQSKKGFDQDRRQLEEEMQGIRKQIKTKIQRIQDRLYQQEDKKIQQLRGKVASLIDKNQTNNYSIAELIKKTQRQNEAFGSKLANELKAIKSQFDEKINTFKKDFQKNELKPPSRSEVKDKYQKPTTPIIQESKYEQNLIRASYASIQKQANKFQKKPLPPRRNLFENDSPPEIQSSVREMSGGVRGLLQRSKQKQRQQSSRRPAPLSREKQSSKKGLPPVKQDPLAKRKKTQGSRRPVQTESQQQQMVYQIDQQGYLMDQEGNYLVNSSNQMIRLSPEEIEQYMDGQSY